MTVAPLLFMDTAASNEVGLGVNVVLKSSSGNCSVATTCDGDRAEHRIGHIRARWNRAPMMFMVWIKTRYAFTKISSIKVCVWTILEENWRKK